MFVGAGIWARYFDDVDLRIGKLKIRGRGNRMDTNIIQEAEEMSRRSKQKRPKGERRIFGSRKGKS